MTALGTPDLDRSLLTLVQSILDDEDLEYVTLDATPSVLGLVIPFEGDEHVVISIPRDGQCGTITCSAGVLKNVDRRPLVLLDLCNEVAWNSPMLPAYLHAGGREWDVLLRQRLPRVLIVGGDGFLTEFVVAMATEAARVREHFLSRGVNGASYTLNIADMNRLRHRSVA